MPRYYDMDALAEMIRARADMLIEGSQALHFIANWLDKLHPADVAEVVHAEWKPLEVDGDIWFYCSECEAEISTSWDYENDDMWAYCPVCGAKMDGKDKDKNK